MSTDLQIEANRRNSRKSTGPRSVAGKATSSLNSLNSGIYAEAEIIHDENAPDLEALVADYHHRFQPDSPDKRCLIDILVHSEWILRRLRRAEGQLWERNVEVSASSYKENTFELARALNHDASKVFARLQHRLTATQRNYERALKDLKRLQPDPPPEIPTAKIEPVSAPPDPQIGFVPSIVAKSIVPSPLPPASAHIFNPSQIRQASPSPISHCPAYREPLVHWYLPPQIKQIA
jgi:hypothetical protein